MRIPTQHLSLAVVLAFLVLLTIEYSLNITTGIIVDSSPLDFLALTAIFAMFAYIFIPPALPSHVSYATFTILATFSILHIATPHSPSIVFAPLVYGTAFLFTTYALHHASVTTTSEKPD